MTIEEAKAGMSEEAKKTFAEAEEELNRAEAEEEQAYEEVKAIKEAERLATKKWYVARMKTTRANAHVNNLLIKAGA